MPYWTELIQTCPSSPYLPEALYHAGRLLAEAAWLDSPAQDSSAQDSPSRKTPTQDSPSQKSPAQDSPPQKSPAQDSSAKLRQAFGYLERLVQQYPHSPWTADAYVWLVDLGLEVLLDLPTAEKYLKAALAYLEGRSGQLGNPSGAEGKDAASAGSDFPPAPGPAADHGLALPRGCFQWVRMERKEGSVRFVAPGPADWMSDRLEPATPWTIAPMPTQRMAYEIYLRAGLIAYLKERPEEAVGWFEKAKPFQPPRDFVVVYGHIPTGLEKLIEAARQGKVLTPPEARQGDPAAKWMLMLADLYHEAEQWERSLELCNRVLQAKGFAQAGGKGFQSTAAQKSWALFRRGRNYYCMDGEKFEPEAAFIDYKAAVNIAPTVPWAAEAMFLGANILWNCKRDGDAAIAEWRRMIRLYPTHRDTETAAYFIGVIYKWTNRPEEARKAFKEFLATWPDSRFTSAAKRELKELEPNPVKKRQSLDH